MSHIIHIETSTSVCSVALSKDDGLIACIEITEGFSHAEKLTLIIQEIIEGSNITLKDLSAIAVSAGPGSYTGLRIGASTAKGLCYALEIPLIAISSLQVLARATFDKVKDANGIYLPMIDARRMEVYTAAYYSNFELIKPEWNEIITEHSFSDLLDKRTIYFAGDGAEKCKLHLANRRFVFVEEVLCSAKFMVADVFKKFQNKEFENVAYFEPNYLKAFYTPIKKIV